MKASTSRKINTRMTDIIITCYPCMQAHQEATKVNIRFFFTLTAIIIAGAILASNFFSKDGYKRINHLRTQVIKLEAEKTKLINTVETLEKKIESLKTDGKYKRKTIRDELGYVAENEIIIDMKKSGSK
jgi:cell division protein FtsB